jgi:hypothetical protein
VTDFVVDPDLELCVSTFASQLDDEELSQLTLHFSSRRFVFSQRVDLFQWREMGDETQRETTKPHGHSLPLQPLYLFKNDYAIQHPPKLKRRQFSFPLVASGTTLVTPISFPKKVGSTFPFLRFSDCPILQFSDYPIIRFSDSPFLHFFIFCSIDGCV